MRRSLKYGAWVLLVIAILSVAAWTIANGVGSHRLKTAVRSLQESGCPTSASQLAPSPLSRAENGAPLYAAAFALMEAVGEEERELLEKALESGAAAVPDRERAKLEAWVAKNADALELLARAGARSRCRFERNYAEGIALALPELSQALRMGELLQIRAELRAASGDVPGARSDVAGLLRLSDAFREETILVSQLVRLNLMRRAVELVDRLVTSRTPGEELKAWDEAVRAVRVPAGVLYPAFRGETAMVADVLHRPSYDLSVMAGTVPSTWHLALEGLLRPLFKLDGAECLDAYRRMAEAAALPHRQAQKAAEAINREMAPSSSWRHPLRGLFFPSGFRAFGTCVEVEAKAAVVRAGLEAERIRQSTGAYPEKIDEADPASGEPLLYDRAAGRIASAAGTKDDPIEWRLRSR